MRGGIGCAVKHDHITTNQVDVIYMERSRLRFNDDR